MGGQRFDQVQRIILLMLRSHPAGFPRVDITAFIDDSAQVIGDVEVGEDSSVWMNAVLRGDVNRIRVGARTNIQDGAIVHGLRDVHPTLLGDEVTVGHGAILHGCVIEDRCLIGMGAIVLNGVEVGTGSIIAAGTLVVEGTQIPAGSLVMGNPGRVKRTVDKDEVVSIRRYAANYVKYQRDFVAAQENPRSGAMTSSGSG